MEGAEEIEKFIKEKRKSRRSSLSRKRYVIVYFTLFFVLNINSLNYDT